ncbi:MAG: PQQ-dependent sugar dehydrogenase [Planctomycetota bacterium]|nr:PQQ-dependent sugar dehydrogenase [Planctomycetota bacterium]
MFTKRILLNAGAMALAMCSGAIAQSDLLPSILPGTIGVNLNPVAAGLGGPAYAINAPGDSNRMFVVEQLGRVRVVQNGSLVSTPALDIRSQVSPPLVTTSVNDERGLLGLAFHPGYNTPSSVGYRTLYTFGSEPVGTGVTYNAPGTTGNALFPGTQAQTYKMVINEWKQDASNPNIIDPSTRREVFSYGKIETNHNGGTIAFGPDGYMYLGTGDGGASYDTNRFNTTNGTVVGSHIEPGGNAANLSTPLGKMLRIDPVNPALTSSSDPISSNGQYRIPSTNPFQGINQVAETYAYGLRNPYRFAFDDRPGGSGQLIAADVGQGNIEEINSIVNGGNYGWRNKEGTFLVNFSQPDPLRGNTITGSIGVNSPEAPGSLIKDPIKGTLGYLQYDHEDGISITGGFVYRGSEIPELVGKYVFGDLALRTGPRADGRLFYANLETGIINEFLLPQFSGGILPNNEILYGFGQDFNGELYALTQASGVASGAIRPSTGTLGGTMYRISAVPEPGTVFLLVGASAGAFLARRRIFAKAS